MKKEAEE